MKSETWSRIGVGALLIVGMLWMFPDLYSELKTWQTAIAALLGFGGLIWAVTLSARKQRDRDDHIRRQDIRAMARGLKFEISTITRSLKAKTDAIEAFTTIPGISKQSIIPSGFVEKMITPTTPQLYERCLEKIGFLPDNTCKKVMAYYSVLAMISDLVYEMIRAGHETMDLEKAQQIASTFEQLPAAAQIAIASLDQFLEKNGGGAA